MFNPVDNRGLYNIVDGFRKTIQPLSDYYLHFAKQCNRVSDSISLPGGGFPFLFSDKNHDFYTHPRKILRSMAGYFYFSHLLTTTYKKPEFCIQEIKIEDDYIDIIQKVTCKKSFCNLIHFKKNNEKYYPKMLIVAPMSGHYATLMRETVRDLLPFYDVYITDWKNARDVPLTEGAFDFDEFSQYMISFFQQLGPDLNVMAVCQATVPVLVALSLMSTENDINVPKTVIMLGGPIDTNQAPTAVNEMATTRGDDWFKQNLISIVPHSYPGYMRLVYPGFIQLTSFMNMNMQKHARAIMGAIRNFSENRTEEAFKTVAFYQEYFSVMDLTAEFYMQTINTVFQKKLLVNGRLKAHGKDVLLRDIKNTAILAIEGGKDDITGVGQTKSVLTLCKNLPDDMKRYVLAQEVGHYGLFNGSKFREVILPEIMNFTEYYNNNLH